MTSRSDDLEIRRSLGPLFEPSHSSPVPTSPLYGSTDKATSAQAAAALLGHPERLGGLQREALELVREFPGRTCKELANLAHARRGDAAQGIEWYRQRIGRRLSEIEAAGLIYAGRTEIDRDTGRKAVTWWPVLEAR